MSMTTLDYFLNKHIPVDNHPLTHTRIGGGVLGQPGGKYYIPDEYNIKFGLDIPYIDFRRNVVTKGIQLNDLIGKKLKIGNVELEGIELCRPCRHLTEMLDQKNILKEFMRKGGLRCQILSSSKINIGDKIKVINN